MSPTAMAFIMIIIVIALILWNKIPMNFIMFVVPFVCALVMGYSIPEISGVILEQISNVMKSAGYMLMFGLIFFTMLGETGMFDIIIDKFVSIVGDKMNVVIVLIMTTVISAIGYLTANISTTYLITLPIMIFLILVVPIIFFVPYQVYNAMYPLFISIGQSFGMTPIAIIAPFVCNLATATSNTPMNSASYLGCSLIEQEDVKGYCVYAGVIMFFTNLVSVIFGILFGLIRL